MLPDLNHLLSYKNEKLLHRYANDYPNNSLSPDIALQEILKYFWLSKKHQLERSEQPDNESLQFRAAIHAEMKEIDDMWHTFLLFTQDYANFCQDYFGSFIHHDPSVEEIAQSQEDYKIDLQRYLSYIYDLLGPQTLKLWF